MATDASLEAAPQARPLPSPVRAAPIDYQRLESYFKLLAYASRIELLSLLREARGLDEIRLTPGPSKAAGRPQRPISRQAVHYHLEQLIQGGLVRIRPSEREGKRLFNEYVVDQASVFGLVEEFRRVSTLGSFTQVRPAETVATVAPQPEAWEAGPKLVLVHGVHEGRAYPLRTTDLALGRGWIIGRKPSAQVLLDYDPFVSLENSELLRGRDGYRLLDLRSARNGTYLNWQRLPLGGEAPLEPGDVIGVGRSLLLFRGK